MSMGGVDWRMGRAMQPRMGGGMGQRPSPLSFPAGPRGQMPMGGMFGKGPMQPGIGIPMQGGAPPSGPPPIPQVFPGRGGGMMNPMLSPKGPMPHNPAIAMQGGTPPTGPRPVPQVMPARGGGQMGGWMLPPWLQGMF